VEVITGRKSQTINVSTFGPQDTTRRWVGRITVGYFVDEAVLAAQALQTVNDLVGFLHERRFGGQVGRAQQTRKGPWQPGRSRGLRLRSATARTGARGTAAHGRGWRRS